jgi:hypothetical protein
MRGVLTREVALGASSRREQLEGLLERAGFVDPGEPRRDPQAPPLQGALRVAEG